MAHYKLKTGNLSKEVINTYKKVEKNFTDKFLEKEEASESGYKMKQGKVGDVLVGAYKNIENSVVDGYKKIEKKFVDTFLEKVDEHQQESK